MPSLSLKTHRKRAISPRDGRGLTVSVRFHSSNRVTLVTGLHSSPVCTRHPVPPVFFFHTSPVFNRQPFHSWIYLLESKLNFSRAVKGSLTRSGAIREIASQAELELRRPLTSVEEEMLLKWLSPQDILDRIHQVDIKKVLWILDCQISF